MIATRQRHRAFATFTAMTLLAIVAIVLETLAVFTVKEARRTRDAADDAQLHALLVAGGEFARNAIPLNQTNIDVSLPAELAPAKLQLTRTTAPTSAVDFEIQAKVGDRSASELVHFVRNGDQWIVDRAELDQ
jgi:hypothetical protein